MSSLRSPTAAARPSAEHGLRARVADRLERVPREPACLALVFAAYATYLLTFGYGRFYWDSEEYWRLGNQFGRTGHFTVASYSNPYRGYSLPLANYALKTFASNLGIGSVTIVELTGAALAALLGVSILPRLARTLFCRADLGLGRMLGLNVVLFLFWRDHFNFPLTDFPSVALAGLGLLALYRRSLAGFYAAGMCFGLATNMRPSYFPALLAVVVVAGLRPDRGEWRRRTLAAGLVLVGALIVSLPQIGINHRHDDGWSPFVRDARALALYNWSAGLVAQRYETYIGPRANYPRTRVFYIDPIAIDVRNGAHIRAVSSYGQYAKLVLEHPLSMAASYGLHGFNGVDVWYPTPYIRDLRDRSAALALVNYTLLFLALARLLIPEARRRLGRIRWSGLLILAVPALDSIPTAVEPRYFLSLTIAAYLLVCFGPDLRASYVPKVGARRAGLLCAFGLFVLVCVALSHATRSQREYPISAAPRSGRAALPDQPRIPDRRSPIPPSRRMVNEPVTAEIRKPGS